MGEIKTAIYSSVIISVLGVLVVFFGWDVAVDKYLTPQIIQKLKADFYLRDEIKHGNFVATDEDSFNTNHKINAERLIELKEGKIATLQIIDDLKQRLSDLSAHFQKYEQEKIAPLGIKLTEISEKLEILKVKDLGRIELTIYFHKDNSDKGTLILNKSNPSISSLIRNNEKYYVASLNNNKERYRVRMQDLKVNGVKVKEAVASLYIDDHDELFRSSNSSGIGTAYLYIE